MLRSAIYFIASAGVLCYDCDCDGVVMDGEYIIYANDINGVCPFCGCEELYCDVYGIGEDAVVKSVTCSSCYSTFPVRYFGDGDSIVGKT